jgi:hypothetical protein
MKTALCALLLAVAADSAWSQTPASAELAAHAAKYKADLTELETLRAAALMQAQNAYASALAAAERTATTSGNIAVVSMIANERAAIASGLMPPGFPPGLSKELQVPRKSYLEANARIRLAEIPRRQAIDAAYLRALGNLAAKSGNDPALASQLDAEKRRLLANAPANTRGDKPNEKSSVINGTFDLTEGEGRAKGWVIKYGEGWNVVRDGTNSILHASVKVLGYSLVFQDIPVPPKARTVTLSGRIRGKLIARAPSHPIYGPAILGVYLDAQDEMTKQWLPMHERGGADAEWKTVKAFQKIPDKQKVIRVLLEVKQVTGEFDFDDIEVEFR